MIKLLGLSALFVAFISMAEAREMVPHRPADIISLAELDPSIQVEMMYAGRDNFLGRPLVGYEANLCFLTKSAAESLKIAQEKLVKLAEKKGRKLSLSVRDCYRPHKSVLGMVEWVNSPGDEAQKEKYFPRLKKSDLIRLEYISSVSGHSRASTVDLTIVESSGESPGEWRELDMGTIVDFFGQESSTSFAGITKLQKANRALLLGLMNVEFKNYSKEWWHYVLKKEPYPNTAFDFDVAEEAAPL